MKHFLTLLIALVVIAPQNVLKAQSTYAQVYQIVQTHCAGSACHDGTVATFNINVTADSLYHELVNVSPLNPAAIGSFYKLIAPGDVQRSFLVRKIGHRISDGLLLPLQYGEYMPFNLPSLQKNDIELVRQWIMVGAPETGNVVDTAMINSYYANGGIDDTCSINAPSASGNQIYFGRVFLRPDTEVEYSYKYNSLFQSPVEVNSITTMLPANDYDFFIGVFKPGQDAGYPYGLRQFSQGSFADMQYTIGAGAGLWNYTLPEGSAFLYPAGQIFDLDLHVRNPSADSIYSTDIYINMDTVPFGTANNYMQVANFANQSIAIPQDSQPHTFTLTCYDSTQTTWNIWKLYSYTHKYGTAFNIYLRNPDGSQGAQVYDGNYDYETSTNTGYYRWGDSVTFRTWQADSLLTVNSQSGFIAQATYVNNAGPDTAVFGFASTNEMMDVGFFYVPGNYIIPTAINSPVAEDLNIKVYPNPVADQFVLQYELPVPATVQIDLFDILGNKVASLVNKGEQVPAGKYTNGFQAATYKLHAGIYLVSFNIGGKVQTRKMIVTE